MTDQEINITIAEWRGWQDIYAVNNKLCGLPPHGYFKAGEMMCHPDIPDYCGDHNALHEVIASLNDQQYQKYYGHLTRITSASAYHCGSIAWNRMIAEASSRQRAEALFHTFNHLKR
jgi:hypothetical protein